jgi:hemin uptake protein HemP
MTSASDDPPKTQTPSKTLTRETPERPVIDLRDLLAGAREAILVHAGEHYRLRVTASGKLILTK